MCIMCKKKKVNTYGTNRDDCNCSSTLSHFTNNHIFKPFQSGFSSVHNSKTVLDTITNHLLMAANSGVLNILVFLGQISTLIQ